MIGGQQPGQDDKGVGITTTLIACTRFNQHAGKVVASLDKTLYNDYVCVVASNKQQIYV